MHKRCTAGIGAACCRLFAKNGAHVVIADIDRAAGQSLAAELGDRGLYVPCDVSSEADIANLVQTAVKEYGKIDVFHNNCGKHAVPAQSAFPSAFLRPSAFLLPCQMESSKARVYLMQKLGHAGARAGIGGRQGREGLIENVDTDDFDRVMEASS